MNLLLILNNCLKEKTTEPLNQWISRQKPKDLKKKINKNFTDPTDLSTKYKRSLTPFMFLINSFGNTQYCKDAVNVELLKILFSNALEVKLTDEVFRQLKSHCHDGAGLKVFSILLEYKHKVELILNRFDSLFYIDLGELAYNNQIDLLKYLIGIKFNNHKKRFMEDYKCHDLMHSGNHAAVDLLLDYYTSNHLTSCLNALFEKPRNPADKKKPYELDMEMLKILIKYKTYEGDLSESLSYLISSGASNTKDALKLLLENGADPNYILPMSSLGSYDRHAGDVPILVACKKGNVDLVRLLVEFGAKTFLESSRTFGTDTTTSTALHQLAIGCSSDESANSQILDILVQGGLSIDRQDSSKDTALHQSCYSDNQSLFNLLIEAGAKLDIQGGYENNTALCIVSANGDYDKVSRLLEAGANAKLSGRSGTPLQQARKYGDMRVVELIENHLRLYPSGVKPQSETSGLSDNLGGAAEAQVMTEKLASAPLSEPTPPTLRRLQVNTEALKIKIAEVTGLIQRYVSYANHDKAFVGQLSDYLRKLDNLFGYDQKQIDGIADYLTDSSEYIASAISNFEKQDAFSASYDHLSAAYDIYSKQDVRDNDLSAKIAALLSRLIEASDDISCLGEEADVDRIIQTMDAQREKLIALNEQGQMAHQASGGAAAAASITKAGLQEIAHDALSYGNILGEGGFGTVYKGTWQHAAVAIKQLKQQSLTEDSVAELHAEATLMSQLRNPHVVQFYGFCFESPHFALVMEYMPDGSMYGLLHSDQPLTWDARTQMGIDVGAGLEYLHQQDILHRDLKSMNVLMHQQGGAYRCKLTDFGLSKVKNETKLTTTMGGKGTLAWMAPELFERRAIYSKASDVYSYAIVLWELAARAIPFADAHNPALISTWVGKGDREDIPTDTPAVITDAITRGWAQDAALRLTASQMVDLLRATQTPAPQPVQQQQFQQPPQAKAGAVAGNFASQRPKAAARGKVAGNLASLAPGAGAGRGTPVAKRGLGPKIGMRPKSGMIPKRGLRPKPGIRLKSVMIPKRGLGPKTGPGLFQASLASAVAKQAASHPKPGMQGNLHSSAGAIPARRMPPPPRR